MKNAIRLTAVVGGLSAATASADVFFADNFETQTLPLTTPQIGNSFTTLGTTGSPFSLESTPAIGTKSLKLTREGIDNPTLNCFSNDGLMLDGAVVEFSWSNYIEHIHRFNAPVQVQLGMVNGLVGRFVFIGVNDPGNGAYFYTDQSGNQINTGVRPSLNAWDSLRAVLTLDVFDPSPNFITGKLDLFVSINGEAEQQLANDVDLAFGEIPTDDSMTPGWNESTAGFMKIQKGPFSGATYYDNLKIQTLGPVTPTANWNVDTNGAWSLGANWSTGSAPNGLGATANFGTVITAGRTVTVDSAHTVGTLSFSSPIAYTVAGSSAITLDSAATPLIAVSEGAHTVSAPVVLNKNTDLNVAAGASVVFSGGVSGVAVDVNKTGDGSAELNNIRLRGLTVAGGTVKVTSGGANNSTAGASSVTALSVAGGPSTPTAKLDLTNNAMIVDYTGVSPINDVRQLLLAGHTGGNGIVSSSSTAAARIGYGEGASIVPGGGTFAGQTVDGTSVVMAFALAGDANLSGSVNLDDFTALAAAFGGSAVWTGGDFNYDGTTNLDDFTALAANFGNSLAEQPRSSVPEPATGMLVAAAVLGLARRARRSC